MNNIRSYYFKHTWTGINIQIEINQEIQITELKNVINEQIMRNLRVNNDYKIIIAGQHRSELANPINLESINQLKSLNSEAFYIRPDNEPIPVAVLERESRRNIQRETEINIITESRRNTNRPYGTNIRRSEERNNSPTQTERSVNLINLTNLECGVCYQNYSLNNYFPWNNCSHYTSCCPNCIINWSNECLRRNVEPSCPICRRNFS